MFCKYCGHALPDDAQYCPHCGHQLQPDPYKHDTYTPSHSPWTIGQIVVGIGTCLLILSFFLPYMTITTLLHTQTYFLINTAYGLPLLLLVLILLLSQYFKQPKHILLTSFIATGLTLYILIKYAYTTTYYVYAPPRLAFYLMPIANLILLTGSIIHYLTYNKRRS